MTLKQVYSTSNESKMETSQTDSHNKLTSDIE